MFILFGGGIFFCLQLHGLIFFSSTGFAFLEDK